MSAGLHGLYSALISWHKFQRDSLISHTCLRVANADGGSWQSQNGGTRLFVATYHNNFPKTRQPWHRQQCWRVAPVRTAPRPGADVWRVPAAHYRRHPDKEAAGGGRHGGDSAAQRVERGNGADDNDRGDEETVRERSPGAM